MNLREKIFKDLPVLLFLFVLFTSCSGSKQEKFVSENVDFACLQTTKLLAQLKEPTGNNYPRTMNDNDELVSTDMYDWTSGFFPGSLWYLYELTQDTIWKNHAEKWTHSLEELKYFTGHHDLGFMMYCSYGNANRLASKKEYKDIIIQSAKSLSSRYNSTTQTIKSWDFNNVSWNETTWSYPVIIDNMMNLELLFAAFKLSGDKTFYDIAVKHANSCFRDFFRDDYSTYHVVDYDTISGAVRHQDTYQGYSSNSMWARGQAWAIYGFTMMFRETKDQNYLAIAAKAADVFLQKLPEDMIPLWDFNVGEDGYVPGKKSYANQFPAKLKDASAAAIVCSALFELGEYIERSNYMDSAIKILYILSSHEYQSGKDGNCNFIIEHCVGSLPHNIEMDKPLVYADYYYLEALIRYKRHIQSLD